MTGGRRDGWGPNAGYGPGASYGPPGGGTGGPGTPYAPETVPSPYGGGPVDGGYADPFAVGSPPLRWLVAAAVAAVAGALAGLLYGTTIGIAAAAWLAAGPVAIGLLAVFAHRDTGQRARPAYSAPSWTPVAYGVTAVLALAGIGLAAWRIAEWAGRL